MPQYRLEWQEEKEVEGVKIVVNYARDIVVSSEEENPDEVARKEAKKIFEELPVFSATLKRVITHFQKKYTKVDKS